MSDDNPFASPAGDPPPRPPGAPDWSRPAYQQHPQWVNPYEQRPHSRFVPRSLVTACHLAAAGAWVFVASVAMLRAMFRSLGGFLAFLLVGPVVGTALVAGLAFAVVGLVVAIPLTAVWWGERHERPGDDLGETVALGHLVVAWVVAGYVLARILW